LKESTWQAFYQTMVEERPADEVAAARLPNEQGTDASTQVRIDR
jgi:hypothetical protein